MAVPGKVETSNKLTLFSLAFSYLAKRLFTDDCHLLSNLLIFMSKTTWTIKVYIFLAPMQIFAGYLLMGRLVFTRTYYVYQLMFMPMDMHMNHCSKLFRMLFEMYTYISSIPSIQYVKPWRDSLWEGVAVWYYEQSDRVYT